MGRASNSEAPRRDLLRGISLRSATALVIANIVGAGIFTTSGFQAEALGHAGLIYLVWIVGGVLAFSGALCFAELGAAMPRAGGEYVYIRETFGPALAFMTAFVSLIAGFSAPVAAAVKSFVRYSAYFFPTLDPEEHLGAGVAIGDAVAIAIVWILVLVHWSGVRGGFAISDWLTLLKVGGVVIFILAAFLVGQGAYSNLVGSSEIFETVRASGGLASALATSLIFVMFCYSGWNASAYVAGEMREPQRDLPRSLLFGTLAVVALYIGLNSVYLFAVGVEGLAGKVEVGLVAARALFGPVGTTLVTLIIGISILASASAMTIAGPRVYFAFGRDFPPLRFLGRVHPKRRTPSAAIFLQGVATSVLILSGRIDQIQQYAGFTLTLFASLAVSCVVVLRFRKPELDRPFRTWAYPLPPLLFLSVSAWMLYWAFGARPVESMLSLLTVAVGGALFWALSRGQAKT